MYSAFACLRHVNSGHLDGVLLAAQASCGLCRIAVSRNESASGDLLVCALKSPAASVSTITFLHQRAPSAVNYPEPATSTLCSNLFGGPTSIGGALLPLPDWSTGAHWRRPLLNDALSTSTGRLAAGYRSGSHEHYSFCEIVGIRSA